MKEEEKIINKLKHFGKKVNKIRTKKGLSIKELSEKTGIAEKYLIKIENGTAKRLNVLQVIDIAKGLNILPHKLCEKI